MNKAYKVSLLFFIFLILLTVKLFAYTNDFLTAKYFLNRQDYARAEDFYYKVIEKTWKYRNEFYYSSNYDLLVIYLKTNNTQKFNEIYNRLRNDRNFSMYLTQIEKLRGLPGDKERTRGTIAEPPILSDKSPSLKPRSSTQNRARVKLSMSQTQNDSPEKTSESLVNSSPKTDSRYIPPEHLPQPLAANVSIISKFENIKGESIVDNLMELALEAVEQKRYNSAKIYFDVIANVYLPENAEAYYNLGTIYYYMKQFNNAEESYLKALMLDEDHLNTLINLGATYFEINQLQKAKEHWIYAAHIAPENKIINHNLKLLNRQPNQIQNSK